MLGQLAARAVPLRRATTTPGMRRSSGRSAASSAREARTQERAVAAEELAVAVAMLGGVAVGLGDPHDAQLRVLSQQPGHAVAVPAQLEELADGQARVVEERLAAHDERIDLHPLDRHGSLRFGFRGGIGGAVRRRGTSTSRARSACGGRRRVGCCASRMAVAASSAALGGGALVRAQVRRDGLADAVAEGAKVEERYAAAAVDRRDPLRVLDEPARVVAAEAHRQPLDEKLGVAQQAAQADLVVAGLDGRVRLDRGLEGARRDRGRLATKLPGRLGKAGRHVHRGETEVGMVVWPLGGRQAGSASSSAGIGPAGSPGPARRPATSSGLAAAAELAAAGSSRRRSGCDGLGGALGRWATGALGHGPKSSRIGRESSDGWTASASATVAPGRAARQRGVARSAARRARATSMETRSIQLSRACAHGHRPRARPAVSDRPTVERRSPGSRRRCWSRWPSRRPRTPPRAGCRAAPCAGRPRRRAPPARPGSCPARRPVPSRGVAHSSPWMTRTLEVRGFGDAAVRGQEDGVVRAGPLGLEAGVDQLRAGGRLDAGRSGSRRRGGSALVMNRSPSRRTSRRRAG